MNKPSGRMLRFAFSCLSRLGCGLAELRASPARYGILGSPFRPERIA